MMAERSKNISLLTAWALAFGCAIGWDAFVLPLTTFLPVAGWLGSILGILLCGALVSVIAWNYHYMMSLHPGPGGVYAYASRAFGSDHGFLAAWFLFLSYAAIAWADATAIGVLGHYYLGKVMNTRFHYMICGSEVCLSCIVLPVLALAGTAVLCCRRKLAARTQSALSVTLALGIVTCFVIAFAHHTGGTEDFWPAFSPKGGVRIFQIMAILALSPWLFVGFEAISNVTPEFRFPVRRSYGVMVGAIASAVAAYALLTLVMASRTGWGGIMKVDFTGDLTFMMHDALDALRSIECGVGGWVLAIAIACSLFTNLICCTVSASRLVSAMAEDGAMPFWFAGRNADGAPRNAIFALAALLVFIAPFGQTVIEIFVDIAVIGVAIAYAYTSAAAFKCARAEGNRFTATFGIIGLALSLVIAACFVMSGFIADIEMVASTSYLVMVAWCLTGLVMFLWVFRHDNKLKFGRSQIVWIFLLSMILVLSVTWVRQSTQEITDKAYSDAIQTHIELCGHDGCEDDVCRSDILLKRRLDEQHARLSGQIMRNNAIMSGLVVLAMALMIMLYNILRRRERHLEHEKTKAKSYFFSTVSHDIRTPLNAIIGFTEMLRMGMKSEEERQQALDAISVSGKTLLGLVNDVLDLSKLEAGKMSISLEPTDCPALFRSIMDGFRISAAKPDLAFRCRVRAMPPLMLDPLRIRQIVFNLVGNATKFTKSGYVLLHAAYEPMPGGDAGVFRLEVTDTGCGISEEDQLRLGGAYVQVGAKQARNGGTGLGLAICRHLAGAMGGRLSFTSQLGKGSTFAIEIPGVKVAHEAVHSVADSADGPIVKKRTNIRRILVVDDQKMNCMVLKAILRSVGDFEVVTAMDGREALDILEKRDTPKFDLVLTDLWMPNLDGEGLVKAIRANPALASLRTIAVTADVEFDAKAANVGFNGVLYKPVTASKLSKIIFGGGGGVVYADSARS